MVTVRSWSLARPLGRVGAFMGGSFASLGRIGQGGTGEFTIASFTHVRKRRMIRSMAAYASAETTGPAGTLSCELRTVNHRYLELSPRLPDDLRAFESQLRERVAAKLSRGKLDLTVRRAGEARSDLLQINHALLARLSEISLDLEARFPKMRIEFTELLRFPGVMQQAEMDPEAQQAALFDVLDRALDALTATRE